MRDKCRVEWCDDCEIDSDEIFDEIKLGMKRDELAIDSMLDGIFKREFRIL